MKKSQENQLMDAITSLCKRRGFIFPGSEIYGGLANTWDYGPLGVELKNNIKQEWWKRFVTMRDDMVGLDSSLLMNTKVWENSGHLSNFSDYLIECKNNKCHNRIRIDEMLSPEELSHFQGSINQIFTTVDFNTKTPLTAEIALDKIKIIHKEMQDLFNKKYKCAECGEKNWSTPAQFNLMLKTSLGAVEGSSIVYFRPETAQGIFINFKNIVDTSRKKLPFGVGQIGKAFRNEITPGNFIFRTREFEQMEIEYFIPEPKTNADWQGHFEAWRGEMHEWIKSLGIKSDEIHELEVPAEELAHYSKKTIDFEYEFPFGRKELYGLAYRTDFDLKNHGLDYTDQEGNKFVPHVIEPSLGVERTVLAVLLSAYAEEVDGDSPDGVASETRVVLKLPAKLAPFKIAVFPLLKNKPELVAAAEEIYHTLKRSWNCDFDDSGNVGKRYRRHDEIGTPYCITVDFDTLENGDVTVRDRDTMKQERIKITDLQNYFSEKI